MTQRNTLVTVIQKTKIDLKSGCWEWQKSKRRGYGSVVYSNKSWYTHRLVYTLVYGDIPSGILVCHHCDNRLCCNPLHLFLGTYKDNTQDMMTKNRGGHRKKLLKNQLEESRLLIQNGVSLCDVAKKFNVSKSTIYSEVSKSYPELITKTTKKTKISNDDTMLIFDSASLAAQHIGVRPGTLQQAMWHGRKCRGYKGEYV